MVSQLMPTPLDGPTLLAAWAVSVYVIWIQLAVARRMRAGEREAGLAWWVVGGLCLGTGVWAETLVTALALDVPSSTGFMVPIVAAAWLPAVMVAGLSLWLAVYTRLPRRWALPSGAIGGAALGGLLVLMLSAMLFKPALGWHPVWLSIGFALLMAVGGASVMVGQRVLRTEALWWRDALLALVMATGLRAGQLALLMAVEIPSSAQPLVEPGLIADPLVPALLGSALVLYLLLHAATRLDERHQRRQAQLAASLEAAQHELHHATCRDHLTHLPNRLGFDAALMAALDQREEPRLAVMVLNLDGFKPIMHRFGHAVGDNLLRQVAARLRAAVRDDDVVARAEGDEFLVLMVEPGDEHAMAQTAQRLSDAVRQPYLFEEGEIELTASMGVAVYPDEPNPLRLVDHATEAMLTARSAGGAVYCFFQAGMERMVERQVALQRDLRHAIDRQELTLHFQPKIDAHNGQLCGVEALLRWRHPERGMVSPGEFIPVAERFGLIGRLGTWVLDEACRQARVWMDAGVDIPVAVNVSVHQLRQADLEHKVREALRRHGVPARMLVLEITESVAMDNIEASLKVFDMLDAIGVQLSIDDFGTGYSSLAYLRRLPARQLKIDRCFVRDLDSGCADAQAIVQAVVRLAHALGLKVVAEGVETESQAQALRDLECDELQGFLFARPMPEYELLAWQVQRRTGAPRVVAPAAPTVDSALPGVAVTAGGSGA